MGRVELADGVLRVSGQFDYVSIPAARTRGEELITQLPGPDCRIDLSAVESGDSVFMALLLSWQRLCQTRNLNLELTGTPDALIAMAKVSGLDGILPLTSKDSRAAKKAP